MVSWVSSPGLRGALPARRVESLCRQDAVSKVAVRRVTTASNPKRRSKCDLYTWRCQSERGLVDEQRDRRRPAGRRIGDLERLGDIIAHTDDGGRYRRREHDLGLREINALQSVLHDRGRRGLLVRGEGDKRPAVRSKGDVAGDDVVVRHQHGPVRGDETVWLRRRGMVGFHCRPGEQTERGDGDDQQHPFENVADGIFDRRVDMRRGERPDVSSCSEFMAHPPSAFVGWPLVTNRVPTYSDHRPSLASRDCPEDPSPRSAPAAASAPDAARRRRPSAALSPIAGKWRRRMNGSAMNRAKANNSHKQTMACIHQKPASRKRSTDRAARSCRSRSTRPR